MLNTSNEYKQIIADSIDNEIAPVFVAKATIILADGAVLNITQADIVEKGLKTSGSTSNSGTFQIGSASIGSCTLLLNNIEHKFDTYDFTGAVVIPETGLKLSETTEYLKKGTYAVDEPVMAKSVIYLSLLDNMSKFDTPFSAVAQAFPCTAQTLLNTVCTYCGVPLATSSFTNSAHIIERRPDDEAITCREIVAWIAQIAGCFARCNVDGALELKWYDIGAFEGTDNIDGGTFDISTPYATGDAVDGGNFIDYNSGDTMDGGTFADMDRYHHIYSLGSATIGTDDVVITGIRVKATGTESDHGETVLFGSNGYVIEISDNPLIQEGNAATIANSIGAKIVGMKFRSCSVTAISDPSREAGDVAYLTHKGNTYQTLLTNINWSIGSQDSISCDAETPSKNKSIRFSAQTKTIVEARKIAKQEISSYDQTVQQFLNLMTYGFGLYKSEELLPDGSTIYYMHNKPTRTESNAVWKFGSNGIFLSTDHGLTWGVDTNGNMLVNVLTAIGINAEWIKVLTSFSVGSNYSVDATGKLTASNAKISGEIEANSGTIGGMEISANGLEKETVLGYLIQFLMTTDGFSIKSSNPIDTVRSFFNVIYDGDDLPIIDISTVIDGAYDNNRVRINGQPILYNLINLQNKVTHMTNFLITSFGYNPTA